MLLAYDHLGTKGKGMYVAIKGTIDLFASLAKAKRVLRELKFSVRLSGHPDLIYLENLLVPSDEETFTGIFMVFKLMRCDLSTRLAEGVAVAQAEAYGIAQNKGRGCGHQVGKPITGRLVKRWMFELLSGLAFLHGSGVLHRDIKPSNLLVDDQDRLRICDMGYVSYSFLFVDGCRRVFFVVWPVPWCLHVLCVDSAVYCALTMMLTPVGMCCHLWVVFLGRFIVLFPPVIDTQTRAG